MPAPRIPDDLLQAQRAFEDADRAVHAHVEAVTAEHGKVWPVEAEDRLEVLRAERMVALEALTSHPAVLAARAGGAYRQLHYALKKAAGADGWENAKG